MTDRDLPSSARLAAWCARELDRAEQLPGPQRADALLRLAAVLTTRLADEHGDDDLGIAADRFITAWGGYLGTDVLEAALASWRRAPSPSPGEPTGPPPDWGAPELDEDPADRWYDLEDEDEPL